MFLFYYFLQDFEASDSNNNEKIINRLGGCEPQIQAPAPNPPTVAPVAAAAAFGTSPLATSAALPPAAKHKEAPAASTAKEAEAGRESSLSDSSDSSSLTSSSEAEERAKEGDDEELGTSEVQNKVKVSRR